MPVDLKGLEIEIIMHLLLEHIKICCTINPGFTQCVNVDLDSKYMHFATKKSDKYIVCLKLSAAVHFQVKHSRSMHNCNSTLVDT